MGAGRDWPTAQEAALKLREGAWVDAFAFETEQLLHGHLAAVDDSVRAYVLEGEGRAAERAADAVRALETLGCETTLLATSHPVVDIVPFQLLTLAVAEARGIDPDPIRRTPGSPLGRRRRRCLPRLVLELRERGEEAVDLVRGVVVDDADPHRAVRQAEALHDLDRVVVAVPHGEAALAEEARRVRRRDAARA